MLVINMNYLELTMKITQTNSVLLSSLSYILKNIGLRLKIVIHQAFPHVFEHATTPLLLIAYKVMN